MEVHHAGSLGLLGEGTNGRNQCVRGVQCDTRVFLIVLDFFFWRSLEESARLAKMIFYYVSTWIEVLCESVKFILCGDQLIDSCADK